MKTTLVTTIKNEGPFIWEWVAHHKMVGFDDIIIFQNDSDDQTDAILKKLKSAGVIKYVYNRAAQGKHQVKAYKRSTNQPVYMEADWVMALDMDEFLLVKTDKGTVQDLIAHCPDGDCIYVNWKKFGSAGEVEMKPDLVTQRFKLAEYGPRIATGLEPFKSLFKRERFLRPGIHRPFPKEGEENIRIYNGSGLPEGDFRIHNFQCTDPGQRALAQVNHYIVKDAESFVLKNARGSAHQANRKIDRMYWRRRNKNQEIDDGMDVYYDALLQKMAELDDLTGGALSALTQKSYDIHKERFKKIIQDDFGRDLYQFCVQAPKPKSLV